MLIEALDYRTKYRLLRELFQSYFDCFTSLFESKTDGAVRRRSNDLRLIKKNLKTCLNLFNQEEINQAIRNSLEDCAETIDARIRTNTPCPLCYSYQYVTAENALGIEHFCAKEKDREKKFKHAVLDGKEFRCLDFRQMKQESFKKYYMIMHKEKELIARALEYATVRFQLQHIQ